MRDRADGTDSLPPFALAWRGRYSELTSAAASWRRVALGGRDLEGPSRGAKATRSAIRLYGGLSVCTARIWI